MNKIKFLNFLNHPESISESDLSKLEELAEQYPYSQVIHILVAKGRHNLELETFRVGLHKAAISVNNRDLLKKLIEDVKVSNIIPPLEAEANTTDEALEKTTSTMDESHSVLAEKEEKVVPEAEATQEDTTSQDTTEVESKADSQKEVQDPPEAGPSGPESGSDLEADKEEVKLGQKDQIEVETEEKLTIDDQDSSEDAGIHSELMANLEKLKQQREKLKAEKKDEATSSLRSEETENLPTETVDNQSVDSPAVETSEMEAGTHEPQENEDLVFDPPMEQLIESSIVSEIDEKYPDKNEEKAEESAISEQQKSQIEIIDSFIKNSPVLSKPNLSADSEATSQADLSVKSAKFHQDFVSENLASILAKQGKRKDAVGIYKKLMVKFPEKKAYFADQIDSLNTK